MAGHINWPVAGATGETYQSPDGDIWVWTGYAWDAVGVQVGPAGPAQSLAQTLVIGQSSDGKGIIMSDGDSIKAASGGGELNLWNSGDNKVFLTNDGGGGLNEALEMEDDYISINTANHFAEFTLEKNVGGTSGYAYTEMRVVGEAFGTNITIRAESFPSAADPGRFTHDYGLHIAFTQGGTVSSFSGYDGGPTAGAILVSTNSSLVQNIKSSVILGGTNIIANTNYCAYANCISLQNAGTTENGFLKPLDPLTVDRTWTFPDATGTVALVSDICCDDELTLAGTEVGPDELLIGGTGGTRVPVATNEIQSFEVTVVAIQSGGTAGTVGDTWSHIYTGAIKNIGGTVSLVGTVTDDTIAEDAGATSWEGAIIADNVNNALTVWGEGETNKDIEWLAKIKVTKNNY